MWARHCDRLDITRSLGHCNAVDCVMQLKKQDQRFHDAYSDVLSALEKGAGPSLG